jgi:hypothetical protein
MVTYNKIRRFASGISKVSNKDLGQGNFACCSPRRRVLGCQDARQETESCSHEYWCIKFGKLKYLVKNELKNS